MGRKIKEKGCFITSVIQGKGLTPKIIPKAVEKYLGINRDKPKAVAAKESPKPKEAEVKEKPAEPKMEAKVNEETAPKQEIEVVEEIITQTQTPVAADNVPDVTSPF